MAHELNPNIHARGGEGDDSYIKYTVYNTVILRFRKKV